MHGESFHISKAPAHTGRGQLKGADLGMIGNLIGRNAAPDSRANAEPQRITRGQNHHPPPSEGAQQTDQRIKGRGPGDALGGDISRKLMMPVATDNNLCGLQHSAGGRGQPVDAIFADTHDMQPVVRHRVKPANGAGQEFSKILARFFAKNLGVGSWRFSWQSCGQRVDRRRCNC